MSSIHGTKSGVYWTSVQFQALPELCIPLPRRSRSGACQTGAMSHMSMQTSCLLPASVVDHCYAHHGNQCGTTYRYGSTHPNPSRTHALFPIGPLPNFLFMFVSSLVKASITGSHCFPSGPRAPMDTPIHGPRNINVDPWCRHGHFQTYFVHCGQCERVLSWFKLVWKRCNEPVPGITYYYVDDSKWWYGICKDCAPEPEDKPPIWRRP